MHPSHVSFGIGVITPRWLYVLAGATPDTFGTPILTDETLEPIEAAAIQSGDIVGIGIHSGNALRGYEVGVMARRAGASVNLERRWSIGCERSTCLNVIDGFGTSRPGR